MKIVCEQPVYDAPPALKYSDDELRDNAGRWTDDRDDPDEVALRFDDVRRWTWATRDEIQQFRDPTSSLGRRFIANMAAADPTTETTYRCAFLPMSEKAVVAEYPPGKTIDLPLLSFSRSESDAGGYINGIMGHEYTAGLADGSVTAVQFRLDPGAQMADLGATGAGVDHEVVTAGRFEVTSVTPDQTVPARFGSGGQTYQQDGVTIIGLKQVATVRP